jgi:DNA-directed RNA polymerase specialized sigma24 family protein
VLKPINEITTAEHALVTGFVAGSSPRRLAVLLRFFEGQSVRYTADQTGLPPSTVHDLARGFEPVYELWRAEQKRAAA